MGPRQAGLLFSCHAVFSTILGFFIFNETMTSWELLGAFLVFCGVVIAIFFKKSHPQKLEMVYGNLWVAISLGLIAAFMPSLGWYFCETSDAGSCRSHRGIGDSDDCRFYHTLPPAH
ncbi:EamA family transporter [Vibrio sp. PP-XX7]